MVERKRDTSKKRNEILDAAADAFTQDGYDNASMDKIADMAGASKRTVYNHFPSKEELFKNVQDQFITEIMALKQIDYNPDETLEKQLGEFANAKLAISTNPSWLGLMKAATGVYMTNPEFAKDAVERAEDAEDTLVTWLEAAQADGRIKVDNSKLAAEAFWAMVAGAFFWPSIFFGPMKPKEAEAMKKELIDLFLSKYGA